MISTFTMLAVYSRTPGRYTQTRRVPTSYTAAVTLPERLARNARKPGRANGDPAIRARRDGAGKLLDAATLLDATAGWAGAEGRGRAAADEPAGLARLAGPPAWPKREQPVTINAIIEMAASRRSLRTRPASPPIRMLPLNAISADNRISRLAENTD